MLRFVLRRKSLRSVGLHTIILQMTGSWQKVKQKQIPWHHFKFFLSVFYSPKNTYVLGSQVRNAVFMHEFAWHQLSYRQETLWSPSWEQSLSLLPVWMVHQKVRQEGSRLRTEAEGRSLYVFHLCAGVPTGVGSGRGVGLAVLHCSRCSMRCIYSCLGGVQVGFFLKLADVFLVPDPFVAKPVGYLRGRAQGGGAEESDVKQPQHRALSSMIVSRCHVWVHQVPNSQPLQ